MGVGDHRHVDFVADNSEESWMMKKLLLFPLYVLVGYVATRLTIRFEESLADIDWTDELDG